MRTDNIEDAYDVRDNIPDTVDSGLTLDATRETIDDLVALVKRAAELLEKAEDANGVQADTIGELESERDEAVQRAEAAEARIETLTEENAELRAELATVGAP